VISLVVKLHRHVLVVRVMVTIVAVVPVVRPLLVLTVRVIARHLDAIGVVTEYVGRPELFVRVVVRPLFHDRHSHVRRPVHAVHVPPPDRHRFGRFQSVRPDDRLVRPPPTVAVRRLVAGQRGRLRVPLRQPPVATAAECGVRTHDRVTVQLVRRFDDCDHSRRRVVRPDPRRRVRVTPVAQRYLRLRHGRLETLLHGRLQNTNRPRYSAVVLLLSPSLPVHHRPL